jgi:hypothetical protein
VKKLTASTALSLTACLLVYGTSAAGAESVFDFEGEVRGVSERLRAEAPEVGGGKIASDPRCAPESPGGSKIYSSDFHWGYGIDEMRARFKEMYESDKRLPRRAYWSVSKAGYELPYYKDRGGVVELPAAFARAVSGHIEAAYRQKVIDGVFFPDMGHAHLLIPKDLYESKYSRYAVKDFGKMYADLFSDPRVEVLYHTAEQLETRGEDGRLVDDEWVRHRYKTRNIVGKNAPSGDLRFEQNPDSRANTVGSVDGFHWWGAGFNLSANKNGCFTYSAKGKSYRFDISMFDLEPDPSAGTGGEWY